MRIATCVHVGTPQIAVIQEQRAVLPALHPRWPRAYQEMQQLVDAGGAALTQLQQLVNTAPASICVPLQHVQLLAPIPRPRKNIVCLGWNYAEHARESAAAAGKDAQLPSHPVVFTKAVTAVNAPYADIPYDPEVSTQLDWEVELGVVIGTGGRHIAVEDALNHVFGYTVINDVSARDVQFRHKQYFLGKSIDGTCPMGPWIVTADEIADPQALELTCRINGETKQRAYTRDMIFDVAHIIATLSHVMTLEPGDVIATGTPPGVGFARTPAEFLKPGDMVECEVSCIGILRNRIA